MYVLKIIINTVVSIYFTVSIKKNNSILFYLFLAVFNANVFTLYIYLFLKYLALKILFYEISNILY